MSNTKASVSANVPFLTQRQAQIGLHELLNLDGGFVDRKKYWSQRDNNECVLDEHPFGLETSIAGSGKQVNSQPRLIAPNVTDMSVKAMKLMLHQHAAVHPVSGRTHFRLRIIRIRRPQEHSERPGQFIHDLYFELITCVGTFICGGVNDYSGEGGYGGEQLEIIFRFIAAFYDKPLEEVVILEANAKAGIDKMRKTYDEHCAGKREAVEA